MRFNSSDPNMTHPHTRKSHHKVHVLHHEHLWITRHPRTLAIILAVLFAGLFAALMSSVHVDL